MVTFDFISSEDIPFLNELLKTFKTVQEDDKLNSLGFASESAIMNHFGLAFIILVILLIHMLVKFILTCGVKPSETPSRWQR